MEKIEGFVILHL